ncbi:MAG: response regulator transcription factor [Candidatus Krumholzibacteriota bacterium]|nr:response regulator transcription factor [Candidatus Krumholzibacteriota bacterium]
MPESFTILIVDDEAPARRDIRRMLGKIKGIKIAGEGKDGLEAVKLIRKLRPDLVLLDIQMPGLDGFQVVKEFINDRDIPAVIFITAYDQYALQAFEVHAVDYLLKPVDEKRLYESINRIMTRKNDRTRAPELEMFLHSMGVVSSRLALRRGQNLIMIDVDDIVFATVSEGEVTVVTSTLQGVPRFRSLDELKEHLPANLFLKVHRSYLANLKKISEIVNDANGNYQLRMEDKGGSVIPLSRLQARKLRKILKW